MLVLRPFSRASFWSVCGAGRTAGNCENSAELDTLIEICTILHTSLLGFLIYSSKIERILEFAKGISSDQMTKLKSKFDSR